MESMDKEMSKILPCCIKTSSGHLIFVHQGPSSGVQLLKKYSKKELIENNSDVKSTIMFA